jgi:hypothetical protein
MRVIFYESDMARSKIIRARVLKGLDKFGIGSRVVHERAFRGAEGDLMISYGLGGQLPTIHREYRKAGKTTILIDLGYWHRTEPQDKCRGYHRVAVNAYHPQAYLNDWTQPGDRFDKLGMHLPITSKITDGYILLAGMSAKAAWLYGMRAEEFERATVRELQLHTDRPIVYRPKPSWANAKPIEGLGYSAPTQGINDALAKAWAVVTHHSNVGIDAVVQSIPVFSADGAVKALSDPSLAQIEDPPEITREERLQFLRNLAYSQWHTDEMADGSMWRFLTDKGLVP